MTDLNPLFPPSSNLYATMANEIVAACGDGGDC